VLWQLDDVTLSDDGVPRLAHVSAAIPPGVTAVLGCSGAGKSSLLNLLVGYERPTGGRVTSGVCQGSHALPVYWAPQSGGLWPHLTVREHLERAMPEAGTGADAAMALLAALDVAERADARPHELSQGERSRVAVARALVADAAVLVMDEPFASVDVARVERYWQVVRERIAASGASLVFATHAPAAVLAEAGHVVCLDAGRLLYGGAVDALYWRPPTREAALCLGECNWLEPEAARLWLDRDSDAPACWRPEQVAIECCEDGPLVVRESRFKGAVAEAELEHEPTGTRRRFYHRPAADRLARGARVALRVLACLVLTLLVGCTGSEGPELVPREMHTWAMPPDGARVPSPRVLAIGHGDEVIVVDRVGRVLVLDATGELLRQWRMPETAAGHPEGACMLADGRIAVADTHYHRVVLFDAEGKVAAMFGQRGTDPGQFLYPVDVVQDPRGTLYVCEYGGNDRVQAFTPDGKFLRAFGSFGTGPDQFQRPAGMAYHAGQVYVADAINNRIQVFRDDGTFAGTLGEAAGRAPSLHFPYDIALGADETLYVVEYGAGRLTRLGLDGTVLGRYGTTGRGEGQLLTPWGVAVDSQGRVRIADTGNRRIVELKL